VLADNVGISHGLYDALLVIGGLDAPPAASLLDMVVICSRLARSRYVCAKGYHHRLMARTVMILCAVGVSYRSYVHA